MARLKGALDALGLNGSERLDIVLMQLVKLLRDGEVVRMSKRTGKAISLSDLLDEVKAWTPPGGTSMPSRIPRWSSIWVLAVREDSETPSTTWNTPTPGSAPTTPAINRCLQGAGGLLPRPGGTLYFWISLLDYLYWITGTALGGLLGRFPHR